MFQKEHSGMKREEALRSSCGDNLRNLGAQQPPVMAQPPSWHSPHHGTSLFFSFFSRLYSVHQWVCACPCTHMLPRACEGKRTAFWSQLSLTVSWDLTSMVRLGGMYLYPLSHLTGSHTGTSSPAVPVCEPPEALLCEPEPWPLASGVPRI